MNASNKMRNDADGFDLAIMPNLKDVKSKDNTSNLMQYIAFYYVNKLDDDLVRLLLLTRLVFKTWWADLGYFLDTTV